MGSSTPIPKGHHGAHSHPFELPAVVMGGAGFSYQNHPRPESLPALEIVLRAFELGLRAIDTSPYYEPSEEILGNVLSHSDLTTRYSRSQYFLMTKCGRIKEDVFDYSPSWIRTSVARSLQRFKTEYLDVVFCHDVEFVTVDEAMEAVGVLFELADSGKIRYVGISGYDLDRLVTVAQRCLAVYGRPIDIVQNWAQLCLQNTRLETFGIPALKAAGVRRVCNSSPLAVGLLRAAGVPVGALGDWHPAPAGLRVASLQAADAVAKQGELLSALGLRFSLERAAQLTSDKFTVATITGIGKMSDLEENVRTVNETLVMSMNETRTNGNSDSDSLSDKTILHRARMAKDEVLVKMVREILGPWLDYDFSTKKVRTNLDISMSSAPSASVTCAQIVNSRL